MEYLTKSHSTLILLDCSAFVIQNSSIECEYKQCELVFFDSMGYSKLNNIKSGQLLLVHSNDTSDVPTDISFYEQCGHYTNDTAIVIIIYQHFYEVKVSLSHVKLNIDKPIRIFCSNCEGQNLIIIREMTLIGTIFSNNIIEIQFISCERTERYAQIGSTVQLADCHFTNISGTGIIVYVKVDVLVTYSVVYIIDSSFKHIKANVILQTDSKSVIPNHRHHLSMLIQNTTFSVINTIAVVLMKDTSMALKGPVIFTNTTIYVIILSITSRVSFIYHIQFSYNIIHYGIVASPVIINGNTTLDIVANNFSDFFFTLDADKNTNLYCLFQYSEINQTYRLNSGEHLLPLQYKKYSIVVQNNIGHALFKKKFATAHCEWADFSVYKYSDPHEINNHIIKYINNDIEFTERVKNICYCTDDQHYNCTIDELGPVYPGQTHALNLIFKLHSKFNYNVEFPVIVRSIEGPNRACKSYGMKAEIQLFQNTCTKIDYNARYSKNENSCELYFHGTAMMKQVRLNRLWRFLWKFVDAYRIKILPCPIGFIFCEHNQMCWCDPVLEIVKNCNIDEQTVVRPASSWIVDSTSEHDHHTYQVSLQCPFDYCLPHSSHLNLSNPDSQCQFNRTGLLCGKCKEGLSTVFGTSQCKHCTNYYLILILPFTLAGIAVVILLFMSNLTVADGNINGLIFYANIVSINDPVFFSNYKVTKYAYMLISFLNLDLGVETCFYNGMDDYAKMWLQLIFPIYLIIIAALLIITSRYSTRIQRLTAHRALQVLATLFLLSYTKILRTVSSVLFSYSTITCLPNKTTRLVWSVDTDTELFKMKFNYLFVVCLILFLILLPFNLVLIFTRTLSRLKFINHFKPMLDAYQGPYKNRFYYWTGIQLLLRAVFYGISALDRSTNMMIGSIILGAMEYTHGTYYPFKNNAKNHFELSLLFNLQILFVVSIYTTSNSIAVNTLVSLALGQFVVSILYRPILHSKLKLSWTLLAKLHSKYFNRKQSPSTVPRQCIELCNIPPEVEYNYTEFRESLIELDEF